MRFEVGCSKAIILPVASDKEEEQKDISYLFQLSILLKCPVCGKKTELLEEYLKLSDTQYKGLFGCKDHGLIFVTLERTVMEDGKKGIFQTAKISDEQSLPYVNTKRLQWRNKLEARKNAPRKKRQTATKPEDSHADTVS